MEIQTQSPPVSRAAFWIGWVLSVLPCLLLVFSGLAKLAKPAAVVDGMNQFGYSEKLLLPLGITELACTVIYLFPPTAVLGAVLLTGYLGGATATNVRVSNPQFILPAILGVVLWVGLYLRDHRIRALLPLRS